MIELLVDNSYSKITGLTAIQEKNLRKILSYSVEAYNGPSYYRRYLINGRGEFPTGLLNYVTEFLTSLNVPNRLIDKRKPKRLGEIPIYFQKPITPYSWQLKALPIADLNPRAGFVAVTGSGKSLAMALLVEQFKLKTLIVVPSLEIRNQMRESFKTWFGLNYDICVTIENIDSPVLQQRSDFDMLIIDECHRAAASTYRRLNKKLWGGIYRRYFFSATFFRNNDNEQLIFEGICGQVLYELGYKEAVHNDYIVPVDAFYIEVPKTIVEGYTWQQVYKELVVNNEPRNAVIADLLRSLDNQGKSTLCLVKEIAHGDQLRDLTGLPFANGQDETSRQYIKQFNSGEIKTLIATTGVMGEGVDSKPCEYVIIAGLGKAKSAFMQQIGRAVRKYPSKESAKVVIFYDASHKWTKRHFNAQKKILKEVYGVKLEKL